MAAMNFSTAVRPWAISCSSTLYWAGLSAIVRSRSRAHKFSCLPDICPPQASRQRRPRCIRPAHNGLARKEASEALSHLAYYAGWPNAFSAAPNFRAVFEQRQAN